MKKFNQLLFLCFVFLFAGICSAQAQETQDFDELPVDKVAIVKSKGKTISPKYIITSTPSSLVAAFGEPKSKTIEFAEMDQVNFTVYRYPGGEFSFYEDKLYYFHLSGPGFQLLTPTSTTNAPKYSIKAGDHIDRIKPVYPKSYQARNSDGVLFFWLYSLTRNKSTKKSTRTRLEPGIGLFTTNGLITDIVFEE